MQKEYSRTTLFIINEDLWKWAKFRADTLGKNSVSEYLFDLIKKAKTMEELMAETTWVSSLVNLNQAYNDVCSGENDLDVLVAKHKITHDEAKLLVDGFRILGDKEEYKK